eukprot:g1930.t1
MYSASSRLLAAMLGVAYARGDREYDAPTNAPTVFPTAAADPDALESRVGFWSDNTLWQAQANKSYALELNGNAWIPSRWHVTPDEDTNKLEVLTTEGTLRWGNTSGALSLTARMINIRGGYMLIGTQSHPFQDKAITTLHGVDEWGGGATRPPQRLRAAARPFPSAGAWRFIIREVLAACFAIAQAAMATYTTPL